MNTPGICGFRFQTGAIKRDVLSTMLKFKKQKFRFQTGAIKSLV